MLVNNTMIRGSSLSTSQGPSQLQQHDNNEVVKSDNSFSFAEEEKKEGTVLPDRTEQSSSHADKLVDGSLSFEGEVRSVLRVASGTFTSAAARFTNRWSCSK